MAKPKEDAIQVINKLYSDGNTIIIYSARTWLEYEMTEHWLNQNGILYHQLILGKPIGDFWIDDRALKFTNWLDILKKLKK